MMKLLLAAALALAPAASAARTQPAGGAPLASAAPVADADPALWVVRDADTIIYLFGTFHMLDGRPWFNDEVRTAFDASDELVLEAILPENPADLGPMMIRYAVDPQGRLLSARLTPGQNQTLNAALATLGVPAGAFDRMEPWFVSMMLAAVISRRLGIDAAHGAETILSRAARERSMPVGELEGMEWQLRQFDGLPEAQQLAMLREGLDKLDEMEGALAPMLAAWSTGDVERMQRTIDEMGESDPALHRMLFTDRNNNWAQWIERRMARPGTVFIAVGAGHLAGNDSVQRALAARRIRAERVPHVERAAGGERGF